MEHKYFIENGRKASYLEWITSKGTNYTCYLNYVNGLDEQAKINIKIDNIRTTIGAITCPIQFMFFYWTILLFILHKFNFKKPVMKIILLHFVLRSIGDILNRLGDLMPNYYANKIVDGVVECEISAGSCEKHPLKWLITRQFGVMFWFAGEIAADWYPLLRTHAVVRDSKSIWIVYVTCAIFNLSKISMMVYHWTLSPTELYKPDGEYDVRRVTDFYYIYWIIHLVIIYASVTYDFSVYFVLKRKLFEIKSDIGFLKKFRSMSIYRIYVSVFVCIVFLPIVSLTVLLKYYYSYKYNYKDLNFSFDEVRQMIANLQYFMIFIDQIMLIVYKDSSYSGGNSSYPSNPYPTYYYSSNKSNFSNPSVRSNNDYVKKGFQPSSSIHFQNLVNSNLSSMNNNVNGSVNSVNSTNSKSNYNYNNNNASENYRYRNNADYEYSSKNDGLINSNSYNYLTEFNNASSFKKNTKTIGNYDDYNGPNSNEWNYLSK